MSHSRQPSAASGVYDVCFDVHPNEKGKGPKALLAKFLNKRPNQSDLRKKGILEPQFMFGVPLDYINDSVLCPDGVRPHCFLPLLPERILLFV